MISILSPAKSLDFKSNEAGTSAPRLLDHAEELIGVLKTKSEEDVQSLMDISEKLAVLNVERYHAFKKEHTDHNSKACLMAFKGDVYQGLKAEDFNQEEISFAQEHLRILSGLYGLLRPMDKIQPYRLEMGTKLAFDDYKTLYEYWGKTIAGLLKEDLALQGDNVIINLASQEYFKSLDLSVLDAEVIDIEFKDFKNGEYKIISFYAKKARGMMARYIIKNKINKVEELKGFDEAGYYYDEPNSTSSKLAFKRG